MTIGLFFTLLVIASLIATIAISRKNVTLERQLDELRHREGDLRDARAWRSCRAGGGPDEPLKPLHDEEELERQLDELRHREGDLRDARDGCVRIIRGLHGGRKIARRLSVLYDIEEMRPMAPDEPLKPLHDEEE